MQVNAEQYALWEGACYFHRLRFHTFFFVRTLAKEEVCFAPLVNHQLIGSLVDHVTDLLLRVAIDRLSFCELAKSRNKRSCLLLPSHSQWVHH